MALDIEGYEDKVPAHTLAALQRYVDDNILPGGFLIAVLSNDLFGAVARADSENGHALPWIVKFIYNRMPGDCWGSEEKIYKFLEEKLYGRLDSEA